MKQPKRDFVNTTDSLFGKKQNQIERQTGFLGLYDEGGGKIVDVPNRPGYVYVRLLNDLSGAIQAYNASVLPIWGLSVEVERVQGTKGMVWLVVGVDKYSSININNAPGTSYLPKHGDQHSFNLNTTGTTMGSDPVWVYKEQFMPFNVVPSNPLSMSLTVNADVYKNNSGFNYFGTTGTVSFQDLVPSEIDMARFVTICLDTDTNTLAYLTGTLLDSDTLISNPYDYMPAPTDASWIPLKAVCLVYGMTAVRWNNLFDLRTLFDVSSEVLINDFLDLDDTPNSYTGQAGRVVTVKNDETGLEFRQLTGTAPPTDKYYRQFVYTVDGSDFSFVTTTGGYPVFALQPLEEL